MEAIKYNLPNRNINNYATIKHKMPPKFGPETQQMLRQSELHNRTHQSATLSLLIGLSLLSATTLTVQNVLAINSVLDLNGTYPYLIDNSTGRVIEPRDYMDFDNLYAPNETYLQTRSAQARNYHLIKAFDFANYFQSDYWHYSNRDDLLKSAQPVADPTKCSQQLDWLEKYLNRSEEVLFKAGEQHLNLMTLVDSFGHPEASTYFGHGYWLGSYHECLRTQIDMDKFELEEQSDCLKRTRGSHESCATKQQDGRNTTTTNGDKLVKFRYCIGKGRDIDWPTSEQDNYVPRISYKIGLCLPETCETLSFERHAKQLERLMRLNLPEYTRRRIELRDIYCLPDNRSPIRQLPLVSRIFLTLVLAWLATLFAATFVYSCYKRQQKDLRNILSLEGPNQSAAQFIVAQTATPTSPPSMTCNNGHLTSNGQLNHCVIVPNCCVEAENKRNNNILADSSKLLLKIQPMKTTTSIDLDGGDQSPQPPQEMPTPLAATTTKCDSLTPHRSSSSSSISSWLNESPLVIKILKALSVRETLREFTRPPEMLRQTKSNSRRLRINLNALDSIKCLCCVLVIFGHIIFIHMQHLSNIVHTIELSYEIYPRILIAFFNFVDTFFIISGMLTAYFIFKRFNGKTFSSPLVWFHVSMLRLLRLSPVYILVFWFIKTLSVHLTDGPVWDYGTDKNSIKGLCMNDHWWKSILYLGNWGTMQPLCILPAWSIIVDAQYSLILPPIIFLIFKNQRLGYLTLLVAVVVSTTKMSVQLANQTAVKASDMAKMRLHVYPLISRFAAEFYNTAWNRIGPVAIGIIGGHVLYLYDQGKIRRWPWFMRDTAFKMILLLHLIIFLLPAIGLITDDPKSDSDTDMTIFIMSNASIKPIWSLINTIFLLRLITDLRWHSYVAKLMSHNIWHCLGKLCFTSYLIHYEIILTFLKSRQEGLIDPNWSNALREFSAVFLISTLLSYFIYILYEAPVNKLIMLTFEKRANSIKRTTANGHGDGNDKVKTTNVDEPTRPNGGGGGDNSGNMFHYCNGKQQHHHSSDHLKTNSRPDVEYSQLACNNNNNNNTAKTSSQVFETTPGQ